MRKDFEQLFSHVTAPEPPADLLGRILSRIGREQGLATLKKRVVIFASAMLASGAATTVSLFALKTEVEASGFAQFLSLLFSDAAIVLASWRSFAYSLLESLPAVGLAAFLAAALVFAGSLSFLSRDMRTLLRSRSHFA